jgi:aminopeptidase N
MMPCVRDVIPEMVTLNWWFEKGGIKMTRSNRNLALVLALLLACVWAGGCNGGKATKQPTARFTATVPVATAPAEPEAAEIETGAPASTATAIDGPTPIPASTPIPFRHFDTAWDDREIFRQGLVDAAREALDRLPGASVYRIAFEISDDLYLLGGQEQVRYTNREDEPLDEIYFRLFPNIAGGAATVSALQVDGQDVEPAYEYQDSALRVPLPTALQPGEQVVIQMDFKVQVAREMAGNYGLFGYFDGVLVLDEFYPVIPVYDDEGWNVEVPPPNGDVTHFDASFYLVRVTAPTGLMVVASGVQVEREDGGDNQVLTFAAGPARDFYLAASENYTVISETVGETTVNSYAFAERAQGAELALQFATGALRSYSERFGVYPYTEFDVVSTPMLALGMEYPGIVDIALTLYDPDEEVWGSPSQVVLESTVAHEVAHQWFYNVVGNDQVDEPWLDEAVVQYATGLYYVDVYGECAAQGFRDSWEGRWDSVDRAEIPIGLPSGAYAEGEYGPIVYGRGPLFIAALAEEMGQETLDEFLRDYYQSHKWGIGTGDAFRQLAEQHCQCDLTALFEEWVYGEAPAAQPTEAVPSTG